MRCFPRGGREYKKCLFAKFSGGSSKSSPLTHVSPHPTGAGSPAPALPLQDWDKVTRLTPNPIQGSLFVKLRWRHGSAERVTKTCFSYSAACLAKTDIAAHLSLSLVSPALPARRPWKLCVQLQSNLTASSSGSPSRRCRPSTWIIRFTCRRRCQLPQGRNFGCHHGASASGCQVAVTVLLLSLPPRNA